MQAFVVVDCIDGVRLCVAGCGIPTSVDFISTDSYQMVASYSAAKAIVFDLETGQSVLNLDSSSTYGEHVYLLCVLCVYCLLYMYSVL